MAEHVFELNGEWSGGLDGLGEFSTDTLNSSISTPVALGGKGNGTNPEDLILAASASCYLITMAAILQYQKLPFKKINLKSKAIFSMSNMGPSIKRIEHYPEVLLSSNGDRDLVEKIQHCFSLAKQSCMISSAMKNNVETMAYGKIIENVST